MSIRRREFMAALGGAAGWPLAARAQERKPVRRVGILINLPVEDTESQARYAAFLQALGELGWTVGRNLQIEIRWGPGAVDRNRKYAAELVGSTPDVIVAAGTPAVTSLQQLTRTVPIVFVSVADPVGAGFVTSLAAPGGNITGFTPYEYGISGKWLELLKQLAPGVTRGAVLRDPRNPSEIAQFAAIQSMAPLLGILSSPLDVRDAGEIERAVGTFARQPNGGLIVTGSNSGIAHRELIVALAARYGLPAVYPARVYVTSGGLFSYGPDVVNQYRQAAGYVDRILKGERPADLPVQAPTKYETVINLKTAKALGLDIPATVYARANEVIE